MKRSTVPSTLTWNGKAGRDLEEFIQKFSGYVIQQHQLGYILSNKLALLWLKHGNYEITLRLGMQQNIHSQLAHISVVQFANDIQWLFGALKQCLTRRGSSIITALEDDQDGILEWKKFLN